MTEFAWHIHHNVLVEPLTESIAKRRAYIREVKIKSERTLRLRLLKPVRGVLPSAVTEAYTARAEAWATYQKVRDSSDFGLSGIDLGLACDLAKDAYDEAYANNRAKIEALHAQECPSCPWDGETIFPR
ncbi:hypothetical protein LCGC14_1820140 [marine sediment metagenome]|uniref:Uncharacterized protein n=1 Tax=marine sediment metagenome TaxID=412755 RepID=A0A0F9IYZ9_9ZZZZ